MSIEAIRNIYVKPEEVDITPMDHEEIKQIQKEKPENTGRNDDVGGAVKELEEKFGVNTGPNNNAEGQDKRKKCLQSIEEPNYKLGIVFQISYFGKREKGISPAPALFVFSKRARTNNYRTTSSRT